MIAVTLPQLSISMEDGKVVRWLVADGELVSDGQLIVEIETDKATIEVEAPGDGIIRLLAQEGAVVAVEGTLAEIDAGPLAAAQPAAERTQAPAEATATNQHEDDLSPPEQGRDIASRRLIASPAARRMARELGIDLGPVRGSGPGGRIIARDLPQIAPGRRQLREAVVAHIVASWQQIPHIHVVGELDGTGLAAARRQVAVSQEEKVTVTDLLVLAVVGALRDVPELNGELGKPSEQIHVALAVAGAGGVVAPVLRHADELSLAELARARAELVAAAHEGRSDKRTLAGGTFTLSNLGAYPVDFFAPVVSGPQIALLATGRLQEKPVAIDGMLAVRNRLWANVAIDHRGADGEAGGRFLAALERRLQQLPTLI